MKRFRAQIERHIRHFCVSDDGTLTVFSACMLLAILLITGASVDLMYQEGVRIRLQSTLDRAVLAAADLDQHQTPETVVTDYVAKAGLGQHLTSVTATGGGTERVVSATADMSVSTLFLPMAGFPTLPVNAASTAEERVSNVEISLVLDISGSMRWNGRIQNTRIGASDFINKVLNENNGGVTTLNLIPFAGQVNPGTVMFDYFRGERPKLQGNNGWGNGDQDAPGNSLCNNNAENAEEGASDPSCTDGATAETPAETGHFTTWAAPITNMVLYFDNNGDDVYDRAHKIGGFPEDAPRDMDDLYRGAVAYVAARDPYVDSSGFLGASIKGGQEKTRYFQVKGNLNGPDSDLGPTKNRGRIPGWTYDYAAIDFVAWTASYPDGQEGAIEVNVNMPSSCVEVYDHEFATSDLPTSDDYVPHFQVWPIDAGTMDWGWCPGEDTSIQYYSSNAASLIDYVQNMRLHDGTGLQYGLKYALSLLNPNTRDTVSYLISRGLVDSRFEGRPIDWHDAETEKFIVVMTDGMVTGQYRPVDATAPANGTVDLQTQGYDAYTTLSSQGTNLNNLFSQCQLARDLGVTIFVVAYETTQQAADQLRLCASSESHFFHVSGAEVIETFDIIARQINNLRLIQ